MTDKKRFVFNIEWYEILADFPVKVRVEVYEAIMLYASTGEIVKLSPIAKMAFAFIKREMDYNADRYEAVVEKRRAAVRSRWDKQKSTQKVKSEEEENEYVENQEVNTNSYKPIQAHTNDTDNDNEYDNVNDNIIKNDIKEEKTNKKESAGEAKVLEGEFKAFREAYPGRKRGFATEFAAFKRRYKNWAEIVPKLMPALRRMLDYESEARAAGQWIPQCANLSTWLSQARWEEEYPEVSTFIKQNNLNNSSNYGNAYQSSYGKDAAQERFEEFARHAVAKLTCPAPEPDLSHCY